jgi:hypothetical protein
LSGIEPPPDGGLSDEGFLVFIHNGIIA